MVLRAAGIIVQTKLNIKYKIKNWGHINEVRYYAAIKNEYFMTLRINIVINVK